MSTPEKRVIVQMRWLYALLIIFILCTVANLWIAFARPNESTQTIVGTIGPRGGDGSQGPVGSKGDQGEPGLKGNTGDPGQPGKDGEPGMNGKDGTNGTNGVDGEKGANGRDPEMACVDGYVSWRYTNELEWHPLYAATCPISVQSASE